MKGCTSGYKRKTDFLHQYIQCELRGLDQFTSRGLIFGQDNRMLTSCQQVGEPTGIAETKQNEQLLQPSALSCQATIAPYHLFFHDR